MTQNRYYCPSSCSLRCHFDTYISRIVPLIPRVRQGYSGLALTDEIAYARFLAHRLLKFAYKGIFRPLHQDEGVYEKYLGTAIWPIGPATQG